jgi:DNA-binding transcriptional ArsR family regulator
MWNFLSNHGQALLCIARDPHMRIRDIAECLEITERRTQAIVSDLTDAGYVIKEKDGRRNRYEIQGHFPLPDGVARERAVGEVLDVLAGKEAPPRLAGRSSGGRAPAVRRKK